MCELRNRAGTQGKKCVNQETEQVLTIKMCESRNRAGTHNKNV